MIYNGIISGKYINLRSVLIEDADFTLKIRQNKKKTKFLHNVDDDIEKQRQWIKTQQQRLGDYFFIAENKTGEPIGTIGIYEIHDKKANFGTSTNLSGLPSGPLGISGSSAPSFS